MDGVPVSARAMPSGVYEKKMFQQSENEKADYRYRVRGTPLQSLSCLSLASD